MISLKELKKYLTHRVPFPDKEFDALMKKGRELRFKARMPIIQQGTLDENVYIVRDGMARGVFLANGRENTIYFSFPGDFFASTATLTLGLPAQITIEAFFETAVTAIPMSEFLKTAEQSPVFMPGCPSGFSARYGLLNASGQSWQVMLPSGMMLW